MSSCYPKEITILGKQMHAVGLGKYPYECKAKDKHPNAMIYHTQDGSAWVSSESETFHSRNKGLDSPN